MYEPTASTRTRDAIRAGHEARTEAIRYALDKIFHRNGK